MKQWTETRSTIGVTVLILGLAVARWATAADLHVPADYPTIQAAIDHARTNDTIQIAAGVYTEQVQVLSNKLTLVGQPGTILRATESMLPSPWNPAGAVPILAIRFSDVTVRGLTFEGEHLAERFAGPDVGDLQGIFFRQSSGSVENCAFYGFRESIPGPEGAKAIVFINFDPDPAEVTFRLIGSTLADNYIGMQIVGSPDHQSVTVTIENNTIIGPGPLANLDGEAIWIREGVGGRIAGNRISQNSYIGTTADFPIGLGILAVNQADPHAFGLVQPLFIEGNTFRDNQVHVALINADHSVVTNNLFQGTAPGIIPVGLAVTGKEVTIANNRFEDMKEGIRLMGDDPIFGTILGEADDALVTSNRFCNVTTPMTVQRLANATETGTVRCPFPPPTLAIVPAVLLSWLDEDDGWTMESATTADGPWTASDATIFTQFGRLSTAVPTEGDPRFFRLRESKPKP